jgi:hypothetical protein
MEWRIQPREKKRRTRELSAQHTPDNVFVRERVHLVQITTPGKSFSLGYYKWSRAAGEGNRQRKLTTPEKAAQSS